MISRDDLHLRLWSKAGALNSRTFSDLSDAILITMKEAWIVATSRQTRQSMVYISVSRLGCRHDMIGRRWNASIAPSRVTLRPKVVLLQGHSGYSPLMRKNRGSLQSCSCSYKESVPALTRRQDATHATPGRLASEHTACGSYRYSAYKSCTGD